MVPYVSHQRIWSIEVQYLVNVIFICTRLVEPGVKVFLEKQGKMASGEIVNTEQFEPFSGIMSELPCGCPFSQSVTDSARKREIYVYFH